MMNYQKMILKKENQQMVLNNSNKIISKITPMINNKMHSITMKIKMIQKIKIKKIIANNNKIVKKNLSS